MIKSVQITANLFPVPGLIGLVACGGKSIRMGTDKSMLNYHNKPQRYHLYDMLEPFCELVYISCNSIQLKNMKKGYRVMADLPAYQNIGPMAALLTAFRKYPENDFLLIGCDYPFLSAEEIRHFLKHCHTETTTVFYNEKDDMYEPLLAFYHHGIKESLMEMVQKSQYSLQELLRKSNASKYSPVNLKSIIGINTKDDLMEASKLLALIKNESIV